ncbi:Hypothetical transmembrane protein [Flavobacterium indicum GPTSA100-9 = DSM 17447]|uniref:Hypothetical transmembrane protein n=1 Tax=Flavobacterium indicum (strain DSM 17447 / CIP 109464 / GPTSA100-9) TaxID=1094466 RepID=H8XTY8_FLAIG|nr:hypothetical protein [Flavobacterium indicum]CCG53718.1 Hypothetical transmembrane protein [Flavobacterium indicum GPTSA100-9 = DSM 17447]
MGDKTKNIFITIAYFIFAIAFLSSLGIWLPMAIDNYNLDGISDETFKTLPSNLLTYSLGIFLIATIDRVLFLFFRTGEYSNNILEFFAILFLICGTGFLVFVSLKSIKNSSIDEALKYAKYITVIAWAAWFYVKLQASKSNNFSPIGGIL